MELAANKQLEGSLERFLWLDVVLGVGLVATRVTVQAGAPVHQIVGILWVSGLVVHLTWHRKWLGAAFRGPWQRRAGVKLSNLLVCLLLLAGTVLIPLTGVLAESFSGTAWSWRHHLLGELSLVVVAIHVALHGRWIVRAMKRTGRQASRRSIQPPL